VQVERRQKAGERARRHAGIDAIQRQRAGCVNVERGATVETGAAGDERGQT
jgi:hypothetical protein